MDYESGVIEIAEGVYAWINENCATNAGFIVGEEGVVVIDTLMTPSLAGSLMTVVRDVTQKPIRYVINTHFHGDHVYGNQYFLPTPIVGHENCKFDLDTKWDSNFNRYWSREALRPELSRIVKTTPDVTFNDKMSIWLGSREIQLSFHGRAHSNSDILLYLPEEKVLFVGDLAVNKTLPAFPDGHITDWVSVLEQVDKVDTDTIVPGHGPVGTKAEFNEAKGLLNLLNTQIKSAFDNGSTEDEASKNIDVGIYSGFANQDRIPQIVEMAYKAYRNEL